MSQVPFEIHVEELVCPSGKIPSVVQLNASQPGGSVLLILCAERTVDGGRGEESSYVR